MQGVIKCDGCGKYAEDNEAVNGWLQVKTLTAPSDRLVQLLQQGKTHKDDEVADLLPATIGGEFCRPACLQSYLVHRLNEIAHEKQMKEIDKKKEVVSAGQYL